MIYARLTKKERIEIYDKLIKFGFKSVFEKDFIIDSPFPFAVDLKDKTIGCLTTASYSAAALGNNAILEDKEFIKKINDYITENSNGGIRWLIKRRNKLKKEVLDK